MNQRLEQLVAATRTRLEERRGERPLAELERTVACAPPARGFAAALARDGTALVAEHKRRSPSAGPIREGSAVGDIVAAYERGGAAALSVLTERDHFGGSLADLDEARRASSLPILRKDFALDPYQLWEARAAGADAVLLVVGALERDRLATLHAGARELGLDAIVEVHDERELDAALAIEARLIGINNRNLEDFHVDRAVTLRLLEAIPAGTVVISESGIHSREDVEEVERAGADAVLVGEALMRAPDPEQACRELVRRPAVPTP